MYFRKHPLSRDSDSPLPEILVIAVVLLNLPYLAPYLLDLLCYTYFGKDPLLRDSDSSFPQILALAIVFVHLPDLLCYMYFRKHPLSRDVVRTIINDVGPVA